MINIEREIDRKKRFQAELAEFIEVISNGSIEMLIDLDDDQKDYLLDHLNYCLVQCWNDGAKFVQQHLYAAELLSKEGGQYEQ